MHRPRPSLLLPALLLPVLLLLPVGTAAANDYPPDVATSAFKSDIEWLFDQHITNGIDLDGNGTLESFGPLEPLSREAMAAWSYRFAGSPYARCAWAVRAFEDITWDNRGAFCKEIGWFVHNGITVGIAEDGQVRFKPLQAASREAMAAFFYRMYGSPDLQPMNIYPDVPTDHPFAVEITWLTINGIANGYSNGLYGATDPVSREAAAAFFHRAYVNLGPPTV